MSCLPFCATDPVKAMLKPTLIGSPARTGAASAPHPTAIIASAAMMRRTFNIGVSSLCPAFVVTPFGGGNDDGLVLRQITSSFRRLAEYPTNSTPMDPWPTPSDAADCRGATAAARNDRGPHSCGRAA